ncbi:MAG TPA: hypothetical protein VF290_11950 [Pyrinomonadaceae bacterium]
MNDLRVTKSRFRGVIRFRPVAKDYWKQKREFVLVSQRAVRRAGNVTITFAPSINVTTDRTELRTDFTRIFQTLNVRGAEFWSTTQQTKVRQLLSSLFSTIRESTRSTSRERDFYDKTESSKESRKETATFLSTFATLRENTVAIARAVNQFTHVSELRLCSANSNQHHDHWRVLRSKNTEREVESPSTTNVFTTLSLNFASPKVSETELIQQQIARFVSSPELTYPKRQQATSDSIVQALRSIKAPDPEPKRVAAPALPSIEQITNQVKTQLERELRIERERRGL